MAGEHATGQCTGEGRGTRQQDRQPVVLQDGTQGRAVHRCGDGKQYPGHGTPEQRPDDEGGDDEPPAPKPGAGRRAKEEHQHGLPHRPGGGTPQVGQQQAGRQGDRGHREHREHESMAGHGAFRRSGWERLCHDPGFGAGRPPVAFMRRPPRHGK